MPKPLPLPASPASPQESSLRLPANKRIAIPASQRLNSITDPHANSSRVSRPPSATEDGNATGTGEAVSSTPRRRSLASLRLALPFSRRESGSSKISHPAPPYDWIPDPIEEGLDGRVPVEGEKLRQLRREDDEGKTALWWRRKRVIVLAVVMLLVAALAIGLGIGLSRQQRKRKNAGGPGNRTEEALEFPLGQWTVAATLLEAHTGCVSNPNIWRCYPYTIGGETTFDLTIMNTSALHAPNSNIGADTGAGLAANLTISSSNPFAIPFSNRSLTYMTSATNATADRLEWSFEMTKSVMPSSSVMEDGAAAACVFPSTMFTGIVYLDAPRAGGEAVSSKSEWPYAVEIRQSSQGSGGAVECRSMSGGGVQIPGADGFCDCVYRNYGS